MGKAFPKREAERTSGFNAMCAQGIAFDFLAALAMPACTPPGLSMRTRSPGSFRAPLASLDGTPKRQPSTPESFASILRFR